MAKWELVKFREDSYALRNDKFDGIVIHATDDDAQEIARKMNAFDELIDAMENVCDFLNGEGDVAQIAYRNLRAAITKAEGD